MQSGNSFRRELAAHGIAQVICAAVFALLFQAWKIDLHVPFFYSGDGLVHVGWINNIVETGWFESNARFGYPGGQDLRDFPSTDALHHLTFKVLALFTSDPFLLFNVFYFLTFPLTTFCALFVLRRLGVSTSIAVVMSLLYAFQPYHLLRCGHLLLSAYYLVPFACLIAVRIYQDRPYLAGENDPRGSHRGGTVAVVLLCAALGASGAYYAFFSCFLIMVGGLAGAWTHRRWSPLVRGSAVCAVAFLAFVASAASALQHRLTQPNADVAERHPADAEVYGLKIVQMLMPVRGHRVGRLRDLEGAYTLGPTPLVNENTTAALGIIGAIGLVYLLARAALNRGGSGSTMDGLAVIALAAVLLGTIGGFGSAFSFVVSPWIRGYNRISIFIAFMALAASGLLLEALRHRCFDRSAPEASATSGSRLRWRSIASVAAILLVGALGLLDQTHRRLLPNLEAYRRDYQVDREFVRELEARVPQGSAILQLPNSPYPNYIFRFETFDFNSHEHLRPQLHSKTLRWSYGSMPGHRGYLWSHHLDEMALERQCIVLADAGFQGICIDKWGYSDIGAAILQEMEAILGPPTLVSSDQRLYYFDLSEFTKRLKPPSNDAERERRRDLALNPVLIYWTTGFYEEQIHPKTKEPYRWGRRSAQFILENGSKESQTVQLRCSIAVPEARREYELIVQSDLFNETLKVSPTPTPIERTIVVPPGRHWVQINCDAPVQPPWQEPTKHGIVFCITHFCCEDVLSAEDELRLCEETARLRTR